MTGTGCLDRSVLESTYKAARIINQRTSDFLHYNQHKVCFFPKNLITLWQMVEP